MSDQKALKKRLKVLMQRPENQVCSDCPEKKPTWASLIVPPPGAPGDKIGAFCCLECSGSHRRLGVHISFVRSVNLDAWKEWEVRAMENGGNAKVNAIFEARLSQSGRSKPSHLADGPTRERYIRDKYERRKFYDPAGFSGDYSSVAPPAAAGSSGGGAAGGPRTVGAAPSEIARQRVASRQARMKPAQSNVYDSRSAAPAPAKVAPAPVSAPLLDLLDFGSEPTPAPVAPAPSSGNHDPFASPPAAAPAASAASAAAPSAIPPPKVTGQTAQSSSSAAPTLAKELMRNPAPAAKPATSNESIMALFGPPKQQQPQGGYGMQAMAGMMPQGGNNNMMMGGMMPQQMNQNAQGMNAFGGSAGGANSMMMNNGMGSNNNNQQQQMMMMQQQQKQQQMMMQNMMMNPQMQQQQMKMMQQQRNNQPQMGMNHMNNGMGNNNNNNNANNFNSMMQGMQNMQMGNSNGNMVRQASDDGGFGAPMGGGGTQQQSANNDPFGSLGGMNAFR